MRDVRRAAWTAAEVIHRPLIYAARMENTPLRLGRGFSPVGLGAWQLGGDWGDIDESERHATIDAALDAGVDFIDTADVYGDGRSERLIGEVLAARPNRERVFVATKMGRRAPLDPAAYTLDNFRSWTDRSRANLGVDTLDLVQLHTPPTPVLGDDEVWDALDTLVDEGRVAAYGVSVETVEEGLTAIRRPGTASVQVILNMFRQKPLEQLLPAAAEAGVAIIARIPLASGLLSGKYDAGTVFGADDHRSYNREGAAFDAGETFSGVDFETGLRAVELIRPLVPDGVSMAQLALRWVLMQPEVTVVIPGARNPAQAVANVSAASVPEIPDSSMERIAEIYDDLVRPLVHDRW